FLTPQFACASVQSGLNFARYCDETLDKLIADSKASSDQDERSRLYHQAQQIIQEQALWLPLAHPTAFALLSAKIEGYQVSPFGRQNFASVQMAP
ncbi:ABC transporter substrate-binding protein, partial [Pseudomonas sp. WS 5010]|nr:ABC transporter substrate-binding protein [Pseudomonas sp. WS 5010]